MEEDEMKIENAKCIERYQTNMNFYSWVVRVWGQNISAYFGNNCAEIKPSISA